MKKKREIEKREKGNPEARTSPWIQAHPGLQLKENETSWSFHQVSGRSSCEAKILQDWPSKGRGQGVLPRPRSQTLSWEAERQKMSLVSAALEIPLSELFLLQEWEQEQGQFKTRNNHKQDCQPGRPASCSSRSCCEGGI